MTLPRKRHLIPALRNPSSGIVTSPAPVETVFITKSTTAAFFRDRPKPARHKTSHSTTRLAEIGNALRIRRSSISAGHTISARIGVVVKAGGMANRNFSTWLPGGRVNGSGSKTAVYRPKSKYDVLLG